MFCSLQGHGYSEGFIWSNYDFLLCLLNCWSFCNQTWFDGLSWVIFWKAIVLICSRSRSQQRFKVVMNVHLDIFSTAEPFVTILGMVMQHHGPQCHVKRLVCYFKVKVTVRVPQFRDVWCLPPCLESQGCHFIPLYSLLFVCRVELFFLSFFSTCWPIFMTFFPEKSTISFVKR